MPHHAGLTNRERDEHADDVELDISLVTLASKATTSTIANTGQQEDAVTEREPVAAGVQLARQVPVAGPGSSRAPGSR